MKNPTKVEIDAWKEKVRTQGFLKSVREERERALHVDELDLADDEREHLLRVRETIRESEGLNQEVREMFPEVQDFEEIPMLKIDYRQAIPVFLYWLPRIEKISIKAFIAHLLGIPNVGPLVAPAILQEMKKIVENQPISVGRDIHLQTMAQNVLASSEDAFIDTIEELALDSWVPEQARMWFVRGILKRRRRNAASLFKQFLHSDDKWVIVSALKEIRRRKALELFDSIATLRMHKSKEVREEAEKTCTAFEKAKCKL
jgi:hypothetical protein